jgi:hypothetical protein
MIKSYFLDTEAALRVLRTESIVGTNYSSSNRVVFADVSSTALAIIKAAALKEEEMFYPYYFKLLSLPGFHSLARYSTKETFKHGWKEVSRGQK